jgi:DNA-binding MarR family transcriptional regulator
LSEPRTSTAAIPPRDRARDPELPARLRLAITRTARRLRQEAGTDLGPSQAAALATIERHGPLAPSELAEREGIKRPTATRILARLEQGGFAERVPDPDDGRSSILSATPEGRALLRRLRERKTAYLASRLRELPAEDVEALARATGVLERMLEDDLSRPAREGGRA